MKRLFILLVFLLSFLGAQARETHLFAHRDTCDLYLDIYRPAEGSETTFRGLDKPTILHVFGGGFLVGTRNDPYILRWVNLLNQEGYTVVTMDYRLGMKNYKVEKGLAGLSKASNRFFLSQQIGVEDVFSAISYLEENQLVDTGNLVLAGNSAGAIVSLASAYAVANGQTKGLPEGFQFKGVMSFSGGIISTSGAPRLKRAACPILLFHGERDKAVAYDHLGALGRGLWGSSYLAKKLRQKGSPYTFYSIQNRGHDVAAYHTVLWEYEKAFLESLMLGTPQMADVVLDNPDFPNRGDIRVRDIYNRD